VFEVQPDEIDAEFAVELHERRTVRVIEDAECDVAVIEDRGEVVSGLGSSHKQVDGSRANCYRGRIRGWTR